MKIDVSEDEVDALLQETGINSQETPQPIKEESLEKLLEEIMAAVPTPPPASALSDDRIPLFPPKLEKPKRLRFPLIPIWLSTAVLGAFFLGGALGFYWGRTTNSSITLEALDHKMTQLTQEVHKLVQVMEPPTPSPNEIIQPIQPSSDIKKLIKDAIL